MQIKNTKDVKPSICALIAGNSGIGKTSLAKTLKGKTLILSSEAGLLPLQNHPIDFIEIEGKDDVAKWQHFVKALSFAAKSDYDNIFIDSLTEVSDLVLAHCEKQFPEEKNAFQRWGLYTATMKKMIRYIRDIPKNTFLVTLLKIDKDEVGKRFYAPDISGKMSDKAPAFFDLVFVMKSFQKGEEEIRVLQTFSDSGYVCKDRSGNLGKFEKPDLSLILNKIGGQKNEATKTKENHVSTDRKGLQESSKSNEQVRNNTVNSAKNCTSNNAQGKPN